MPSILFVDDDPLLLVALSRGLRKDRDRWRLVFVGSAQAALDAMELEPFDLVVSDLHMPGTDGAMLFERVRNLHRKTARIILSGNLEPSAGPTARVPAHEVLSKPCSLADLRACIERQLECGSTSSARVRAAVRAISLRTSTSR